MVYLQENKTKIVKLIVCFALIIGVFYVGATPVAASNVFSKTVKKAAGKWSGTARHASTFVKISYGCKRVIVYKDNCSSNSSLNGSHRARIRNSKGTTYGPKKSNGITSNVTKTHYGSTTYFQSEYHI